MKIESKEIIIMTYDNGGITAVVEVGDRIHISYEDKLTVATISKIYKNCFVGEKVSYGINGKISEEPRLFKYESIDKIYGVQ